MLPDKEEGIALLDYYGNLLTKHQQEILSAYFEEDLSMNEIAEEFQVSKAAVSDLLNRSLNQLCDYENKLKLIYKDLKLKEVLKAMRDTGQLSLKDYAAKIDKIYRG